VAHFTIASATARASASGGLARCHPPSHSRCHAASRKSRVQISRNDTSRRCASSHNTSRTH
jgi:hypothetical protein